MTPRLKRARTDSESSDTITMDVETPAKPKQHEKLWFDDGNVVLSTDVHLYNVHRSILAKNSTAFKDMLELPDVGNLSIALSGDISKGDGWEGKPLIRMVGDSDEDVYHLLMVLYDVKFYSSHKPATLPVILSLLRMSSKYNFFDVLYEVTKHLERIYPSDLDGMTNRNTDSLLVDYGFETDDYDFQLLVVAQQCNVKSLIPILYFDCATFSIDFIIRTAEALSLERSTFMRILRGRDRILYYLRQLAVKAAALLAKFVDDPPSFPINQLLEKGRRVEDEDLLSSVCEDCSEACATSLDAFRTEIWESIPGIFELGAWEDVTPKVLDGPSPSIADGMEQAP
ncbi:hypothetical protein SCHPADRAFT_945027 [Schizopora paradoxa]|uniref:BTB domain-containing protein n=1 Tax=Schizopora paradoxa TaxID=27342 RepID=A0A0H2R7E0_9AGAM|nr:hypothetical protein SCHPADRAFT_945027 [Schizopora paradoxa]